jgi:hypothetical protein
MSKGHHASVFSPPESKFYLLGGQEKTQKKMLKKHTQTPWWNEWARLANYFHGILHGSSLRGAPVSKYFSQGVRQGKKTGKKKKKKKEKNEGKRGKED